MLYSSHGKEKHYELIPTFSITIYWCGAGSTVPLWLGLALMALFPHSSKAEKSCIGGMEESRRCKVQCMSGSGRSGWQCHLFRFLVCLHYNKVSSIVSTDPVATVILATFYIGDTDHSSVPTTTATPSLHNHYYSLQSSFISQWIIWWWWFNTHFWPKIEPAYLIQFSFASSFCLSSKKPNVLCEGEVMAF